MSLVEVTRKKLSKAAYDKEPPWPWQTW